MNTERIARTHFSSGYTPVANSYRAQRGVTLIDVVVGSALMLVVFLGISAVFQLSVDVVINNKARAGALALANERLEFVRSLPYSSVGTLGGIPAGAIAQSEVISLNNVSYTRRTVIQYVDDPNDGLGAADTNGITIDYKVIKADVAWTSRNGERHITLVSRVSPPSGMEVACPPTSQCGTLSISVLNSDTQPVSNALVRIINGNANPAIDTTILTNPAGYVTVVGAPVATGYSVSVTKTGYSTDQTYAATAQNTNPTPGHFTVANNQTTSGTFRIDMLSSLAVSTYTLAESSWEDAFTDETKISLMTDTEISGNQVRFEGNQPFPTSGEVRSIEIAPSGLLRWDEFAWNDSRPGGTSVTYRVYYPEGASVALVPEAVLPGNAAGFSTSTEVSLRTILAAQYPRLFLGATLSTINPEAPSPSIQDWTISYEYGAPLSATLSLRGSKTIGSGPSGILYKYNNTGLSTAPSGTANLPNMEWDTYTATLVSPSSRTLSSACPAQPPYLAPNTSLSMSLHYSPSTAHSLLIDVKSSSGEVLSLASVRLERSGYDETILADACGHAFFSGLTSGNHTISVTYQGHQAHSSQINISGASRVSIVLNSM